MKLLSKYITLILTLPLLFSCSKDSTQVAGEVTLNFNNTFKGENIVLGDATSLTASVNTSAVKQTHRFSELRYVISNIILIKDDGSEVPYNINNLDMGARVIDQSKSQTLDFKLENIPIGQYKGIRFGLGVKTELNKLDETRFPAFYKQAGANDTKMHWEWGTGYRFTKIEGFYDKENKELSIHTGSTLSGKIEDESTYTQGVDAYREISLELPTMAVVSESSPKITIEADFDKLLSGKTNTITLGEGNATPSLHTALEMVKFVDNMGGDGTSDLSGMFSISKIEN